MGGILGYLQVPHLAWEGAHCVPGAPALAASSRDVTPFQVYAPAFFEFTVEQVNTNPCVLERREVGRAMKCWYPECLRWQNVLVVGRCRCRLVLDGRF